LSKKGELDRFHMIQLQTESVTKMETEEITILKAGFVNLAYTSWINPFYAIIRLVRPVIP
jgi:hypothetical protein